MYIKMLGGALVILSSAMIGFLVADSFHYRPKILGDLQIALSMLETEIGYGHSPLPEALENISRKCGTDVALLFSTARTYITSKEGYTPDEAWQKALDDFCPGIPLTERDMEALTSFGKYLGFTDRQDQLKNIKLTLSNLKQQETIALDEKEKNEKLWKYLGVLSGIMTFLLLY
jgi:stage III sporulation protein AB